jgi:polysaccharide biosynthesis transport protein
MSDTHTPLGLGEYVEILQRRRIYLLTVIPVVLLLAVMLAFELPARYRASATILLEPSSIPAELVQTTVTNYADQQIELVHRRLMRPERLIALVKEMDPYPGSPELTEREKAWQIASDTQLERVDPITLATLKASNAFSIHYRNPDPQIAAAMVQKIADLFLEYNRQTRGERASTTYDFMLAQATDIEKKIQESEQQIEQFKARHGDALPETQARNVSAIDRLDREVQSAEAQIRAAEERRSLLEIQLRSLSPSLSGSAVDPRTELATLKAQLAEARTRYTADHPDVRRLQRQIEALSAQPATGTGQDGITPDNPDYIAVQSQLQGIEREIAALRSNVVRARGQMRDYESRMSVAPAVEREYSELVRVREVLLEQFRDVQAKLREADVARNLEVGQMGARFAQIRSPSVPRTPYEPNRLGIILIGIILGCGLAAGLVAFSESTDPTVRSARDLRQLTSIPALAAVPVLVNSGDEKRARVQRASYLSGLLVAVAIVAVAILID